MRKWVKICLPILLLTAGAVLCAVRWQAWFGMPKEPQWTGDSLTYTFPAFRQDSTPGSFDVLILGDVHNQLQREDYDSLAARVPEADLVAQVGDWMDRGQEYYHQLLLREWTASRLNGLPVIACPGNHEYSKGLNKSLSPVWYSTFYQPLDFSAIHPLTSVPGVTYYMDLPSVRLIMLDTNPLSRLIYLTRTLTWLRTAMYTAGDRYVVVMMHHPVYSVAKGRFNLLIYATFRYALGQADIVFAGHDHSYMRRTPFVVINTSGRPKKQYFRFTPDATDNVPVYGVLSVKQPADNTHPSPMTLRVYRLSDGQMIDSLYVSHD